MGVVSEVDVQATLKAKLGLDSHPQRLLGLCSPRMAHALLSAEPDIAALLPCGCGLSEATPGRTRIVLQDPRVIAAASGQARGARRLRTGQRRTCGVWPTAWPKTSVPTGSLKPDPEP
jgi:uncharacterized protein (DUF302 family)